MPVVAAALHSQMPAVAAAFKDRAPGARLAYVMTDGAALPLALSDLVAAMREHDLLDTTVTCGHAFGGDFEAVSVYSGARGRAPRRAGPTQRSSRWGRASSAPRLGSGSAASRSARSSTPRRLGGVPIACLRVSFADERPRHYGVSHHTATALRLATRSGSWSWCRSSTTPSRRRAWRQICHNGRHRRPARARQRRRPRRTRAARPPRSAGAVDGARGGGRSCALPGGGGGGRARRVATSMADRLERLLNLTATLLDTRRPLTLDELAERVEPRYPEDKSPHVGGSSSATRKRCASSACRSRSRRSTASAPSRRIASTRRTTTCRRSRSRRASSPRSTSRSPR